MDPRRLTDVRAGDDEKRHIVGSGYLIAPRLVLTARHVVSKEGEDGTWERWERIEVRVGHPGAPYGGVTRCGAAVAWVAASLDVAVLELDKEVEATRAVVWGLPTGRDALDYNGMAFPFHASEDGTRIVEQLRGSLPPLAAGGKEHNLYVLDQAAAPSSPSKKGVQPWGGASGAAVFCQDLLVGVVVSDDPRHGHRRLHAVPVHGFVCDAAFHEVLTAHGLAVPDLQPVSANPRPLYPHDGTRHRVQRAATWAVSVLTLCAVVVAVGVAFTRIDLPDRKDRGDRGHPGQPSASAAAKSPAALSDPAGTADSDVGGLPRGTRLRMTATVSGPEETMQAAFAESDLALLTGVLKMPMISAAPMPADLAKLIETKGYLVPGALVNLVVEGLDGDVEITKIRPVGTSREQIPLGAAFYFPSQGGGDVRQMDFDMDDDSPVARIPSDGTASSSVGRPFFTSQRITVEQGESEKLALNFSTVRGAYTFRVAVNYVAGGKEYSQFIEDGLGKPRLFRISADPCPWEGMRSRLTPQDIRMLGTMHYRHVRDIDEQAAPLGTYQLVSADPADRAMGEALCS
ncbi:trypsin-like peptidase domain-containing protein [Streptomyces sp. CAI-85]|uniref:trypsin-like peptidase domain-containing protein n=1 Tax=Streptomyces sp. CAI-85 TaxID=1472662 RepID=UPI001587DCC9|nr:trypsin-like peptidase domain-containing protein [Streptomyces sp. CAI-85]NUV59137.1 trypsin-like peptidase domain-containing protein [Streptomyces sp. CAI-85]